MRVVLGLLHQPDLRLAAAGRAGPPLHRLRPGAPAAGPRRPLPGGDGDDVPRRWHLPAGFVLVPLGALGLALLCRRGLDPVPLAPGRRRAAASRSGRCGCSSPPPASPCCWSRCPTWSTGSAGPRRSGQERDERQAHRHHRRRDHRPDRRRRHPALAPAQLRTGEEGHRPRPQALQQARQGGAAGGHLRGRRGGRAGAPVHDRRLRRGLGAHLRPRRQPRRHGDRRRRARRPRRLRAGSTAWST